MSYAGYTEVLSRARAVITQTCNAQQAQVNVSALPPGIYLVRVNGSIVSKVVKL